MTDAESKIALLAYYVEIVANIASAIPNDYLARIYGRSLFLGVDSFLALAPRLKNEMRQDGRLNQQQSAQMTLMINKLRSDYESYYATIRDKIAAHQQEVELVLLLETWNEIDKATLDILSGDVHAVWSAMESRGAVSTFKRPPELDDPSMLDAFRGLVGPQGFYMGSDRVAITRQNTTGIIPTGSFQEKAMRVLTGFESIRAAIDNGIEQTTANWFLPEKASIDLFVIDSCSIIDNLFEDRAATTQVVAEDSLVKLWKSNDVQGIERLETFQRDIALELQLRELRNRFSAHLDPDIPLADLEQLLINFPLQNLNSYLNSIWLTFREVCSRDIRTRPFLIHGREIKGIVAMSALAIKPFR